MFRPHSPRVLSIPTQTCINQIFIIIIINYYYYWLWLLYSYYYYYYFFDLQPATCKLYHPLNFFPFLLFPASTFASDTQRHVTVVCVLWRSQVFYPAKTVIWVSQERIMKLRIIKKWLDFRLKSLKIDM